MLSFENVFPLSQKEGREGGKVGGREKEGRMEGKKKGGRKEEERKKGG